MIATRRVIAALATGIVAATAALAGPATAAPQPPIPALTHGTHLENVLVGAGPLSRLIGVDGMHVVGTSTTLLDRTPTVEPARCVGAFEPGHRTAYAAAQPDDVVRAIVADGKPGRAVHSVNQTVVRVADRRAARDLVSAATADWARCSEQAVTSTPRPGRLDEWQLHPVHLRADGTILVQLQTSARATCERAMTATEAQEGAIIVDVMSCDKSGEDPAGQAERIAMTIVDNVGRAH
ncbi:sensor domain-containing protein [Mycolicibacterium confluentis]|uniref:Uncharacterized protein n=1 Tax=Mycolicibacterium confluentis TaxID=28047 RepID=A0A7I7XYS1_9MYCO|nr:sensor domain-containing protein [Mycolicibacterium confluentis]MCV7319480.1 sensor domain-containing protein [Mycolicibacterium confluentis]ORV34113.1 hypothetical protein AWB99_00175 [Mycolicibacterium confluentis]BBZ34500.1 hypothetical protein MCNF_31050 [Mycolicibacterium confluentis]